MALTVGDYTTERLHGRFHIERKSLADLYGTLTSGHRRFRREIGRAQDARIALVVMVEGSRDDMENLRFPRGQDRAVSGRTIVRIASTLSKRAGLLFIWARDRADAKAKTLSLLRAKEKELAPRLKDRAIKTNNQLTSMAKKVNVAELQKKLKAAQKAHAVAMKAADKAVAATAKTGAVVWELETAIAAAATPA